MSNGEARVVTLKEYADGVEGNSEITVSPTVPWNQTPWSRGFRPWPWPLVFLVGF